MDCTLFQLSTFSGQKVVIVQIYITLYLQSNSYFQTNELLDKSAMNTNFNCADLSTTDLKKYAIVMPNSELRQFLIITMLFLAIVSLGWYSDYKSVVRSRRVAPSPKSYLIPVG